MLPSVDRETGEKLGNLNNDVEFTTLVSFREGSYRGTLYTKSNYDPRQRKCKRKEEILAAD